MKFEVAIPMMVVGGIAVSALLGKGEDPTSSLRKAACRASTAAIVAEACL